MGKGAHTQARPNILPLGSTHITLWGFAQRLEDDTIPGTSTVPKHMKTGTKLMRHETVWANKGTYGNSSRGESGGTTSASTCTRPHPCRDARLELPSASTGGGGVEVGRAIKVKVLCLTAKQSPYEAVPRA